jgi:ABC-2 type transport system permease protein
MKQYLSIFRIRFTNGLQYRAAAYAGIATQFFWGVMELLMFGAFYRTDSSHFPMSFEQLSSYIWLQQALLAIFMTWFLDTEIFSAITSGNIAYELSWPMDLYNMWFTKNLAIRLSKAVLRSMPILAVAAFLPEPYRLSLPVNVFGFLMFILTMVLAFFCVVAFCMLIYITTFYTLSPFGVRIVALSLTEFLTGAVIPLPFLPDGVRKVVELTPFASMQNLPLRIYIGNITGRQMTNSILLQIFWLIALVLAGKLWIKKALKKVVIQGG